MTKPITLNIQRTIAEWAAKCCQRLKPDDAIFALVKMNTHSITFNVNAMDSKSFLDRSSDIGAAVVKELQMGSGIGSQIQSAVIGN